MYLHCAASIRNTRVIDLVFEHDGVIFVESSEVLVLALEALYEETEAIGTSCLLRQDQGGVQRRGSYQKTD